MRFFFVLFCLGLFAALAGAGLAIAGVNFAHWVTIGGFGLLLATAPFMSSLYRKHRNQG